MRFFREDYVVDFPQKEGSPKPFFPDWAPQMIA